MNPLFRDIHAVAQVEDGETLRLFVLMLGAALERGTTHLELTTEQLCRLSNTGREETLIGRRKKLATLDVIRVESRLGASNVIRLPVLAEVKESKTKKAAKADPTPPQGLPLSEAPHPQGDNCSDLSSEKDRKKEKKPIDQGGASLVPEPEQPVEPGLVVFSEAEPFITRPVSDHPEVDPDLGVEGQDWAWQRWRKSADKAWIWTKRALRNAAERLWKPGDARPATPEPTPATQKPYVPVRGENVETTATIQAAEQQSMSKTLGYREQVFLEEVEAIRYRFRHVGDGWMQEICDQYAKARRAVDMIAANGFLRDDPERALQLLTA